MKKTCFKENTELIVNDIPFIEKRGDKINFCLGDTFSSAAVVCNILHEIGQMEEEKSA